MPWNEYVFASPLARSPQSSADDGLSITHPPSSVILWRSYQRSGVRKTSPRWGMAAPVLATLITSWTASPTLAAWLPPPSTAAEEIRRRAQAGSKQQSHQPNQLHRRSLTQR